MKALPKSPWEDNAVQFPRLLSEIMATQDKINFESLAEAMDIEVKDVEELFSRAQQEWEKAK